jgi:thymidine kinase
MYAGKTTAALQHVAFLVGRNASYGKFSPLIINSARDTRAADTLSTHSPLAINTTGYESIKLASLKEAPIEGHDLIFIDEAQFFGEELLACVENWLEQGKYLVVAGLNGDFKQQRFGQLSDLLPKADKFEVLTATCHYCMVEAMERVGLVAYSQSVPAPFTVKIAGDKTSQIESGKSDKYRPSCRFHFDAHNKF